MDILICVLTSISLILSIISDIISIQSRKQEGKMETNSKTEITYITRETKFVQTKRE